MVQVKTKNNWKKKLFVSLLGVFVVFFGVFIYFIIYALIYPQTVTNPLLGSLFVAFSVVTYPIDYLYYALSDPLNQQAWVALFMVLIIVFIYLFLFYQLYKLFSALVKKLCKAKK